MLTGPDLWSLAWCYLRSLFRSRQARILESRTRRSQLAIYLQQVFTDKRPRPIPTPAFWLLWVWLLQYWPNWRSALVLVKPETVIRWHHTAFK